jgi:hypothetical protein
MVLRWEATGPGGGLFPVLDADISLSRYGQSQTLLALTGAYRPPLGPVGAALDRIALRRIATATIQRFVKLLADTLADPPDQSPQQAGSRGENQRATSVQATAFPGNHDADPQ